MKQSIPVPVAVAVVAVVALVIIGLLWHRYTARPTAPAGAPQGRSMPADMQKNPNPQDLAKQYGYSNPGGR